MTSPGAPPAVSATHHPYTPMKVSTPKASPLGLPPPATSSPSSPRRRRRRRCRCALCTCCVVFLALLFAVGLGVLIQWLIIRPQNGHYDLRDAKLQTFNLTGTGTGSGSPSFELDTRLHLTFLFNNPNAKMGFDVKAFNVHVSYSGVEIGESADVAPFYQGKRNDTIVGSEVQAAKKVLEATVGEGLQEEIGRGNVSLLVVMNAKVRNNHHMLVALHPFRKVHLTCVVNLEAPKGDTPGNLVGKSCKVKRESSH